MCTCKWIMSREKNKRLPDGTTSTSPRRRVTGWAGRVVASMLRWSPACTAARPPGFGFPQRPVLSNPVRPLSGSTDGEPEREQSRVAQFGQRTVLQHRDELNATDPSQYRHRSTAGQRDG